MYGAKFFSDADTWPDSEEIPRLLNSLMVHYFVHKNPPLAPVQNQIVPVHTLTKDNGGCPRKLLCNQWTSFSSH
jgi:hypothetical protein